MLSNTMPPTSTAQANTSQSTINMLKADLIRAQAETEQSNAWRKECADVCAVLMVRLQELAGFLDSLLQHKDILSVLAQDRQKAMRTAIDRSLDLSRSLNNMSISCGPGRFSLGERSLMDLSSVTELLSSSCFMGTSLAGELESVGGSIGRLSQNYMMVEKLKTENEQLKAELDRLSAESVLGSDSIPFLNPRTKASLVGRVEINSESESWSEPDRQVSHERIGLDDSAKMNTQARTANGKYDSSGSEIVETACQLTRKNSTMRLQEKIGRLELELSETVAKNNRLMHALEEADNGVKMHDQELRSLRQQNDQLTAEKEHLHTRCLEIQAELDEQVRKYKELVIAMDDKIQEVQSLKHNHAAEIDAALSRQNVKYELLRQQMTDDFNKALDRSTNEHRADLENNWVARVKHVQELQKLRDAEQRLGDAQNLLQLMHENEAEIKTQLTEKEVEIRSLKRNVDEASLQTSNAVLERTRVMSERDQLENQLKELKDNYEKLLADKAELYDRHAQMSAYTTRIHNRLIEKEESASYKLSRSASHGNARYTMTPSAHAAGTSSGGEQSGYTSDELKQRADNSSPDLGIESDATVRSSGTEANGTSINRSTEFKKNSMLLEEDEDDSEFISIIFVNFMHLLKF